MLYQIANSTNILLTSILSFVFVLMPPTDGLKAGTKYTEKYTDWSVFVERNPKECWAASLPIKRNIIPQTTANARKVNRSEILLMATVRPGGDQPVFVTFTSGYRIKRNSRVSLQVRGQSYDFTFDGVWAWPAGGPIAEAEILNSLAAGATATMTVTAQVSTVDVFSLRGFSAAWRSAQKRCRSR